jgi:hypothetical protein
MSRSFETVQGCICPDVMENRPNALQSSRRSQCSSASVRTTWLYRPDAIQYLTSIRISTSRHSYWKMAATVQTMCDPIRTMSSIRQEHAYQVQPSGRQCLTVRTQVLNRKDFSEIFKKSCRTVVRPDGPSSPSGRRPYILQQSPILHLSL